MLEHICIISHQHVSRNPRVLKESRSLSEHGYRVTILTSVYNAKLLEEDVELLATHNIKYLFYNNLIDRNFKSYKNRIYSKCGRLYNKFLSENKWALGYAPNTCLLMALQQKADLYICHQELPTYTGMLLIKKGKKVAFDLEDWYTEDLSPLARKYRPQKLLEKTENFILNKASLCYTTSSAMANAMAVRYNVKTPAVIYNSFLTRKSNYRKSAQNRAIRLIWLSQTIGPGRGLENIVHAMNNSTGPHIELNLRGEITKSYKETLSTSMTNASHSIKFLPLISNDEIEKDLINFDIGLALELNTPLSRDLTITNKIFHYLAVGLPVIASATKGQLSLKRDFEKGIRFFENSMELTLILSNLNINDLLDKTDNIVTIYSQKYDWNIMKKKIITLVQNALNKDE